MLKKDKEKADLMLIESVNNLKKALWWISQSADSGDYDRAKEKINNICVDIESIYTDLKEIKGE